MAGTTSPPGRCFGLHRTADAVALHGFSWPCRPVVDKGDGAGSHCAAAPLHRRRRSSRRNMRAGAGSWPAAALVDRHVAIVEPLLVHPLPAHAFFSGQRRPTGGHGGRGVWRGLVRLPVLRKGIRRKARREKKTDQPSMNRFHRLSSPKNSGVRLNMPRFTQPPGTCRQRVGCLSSRRACFT
jgi:hypothetical protein